MISAGIQMRQQLAINKVFSVVDDQHHDSFGHHIASSFGDNLHVRVDQVAYRLHLTLQLGIQRALGAGFCFLKIFGGRKKGKKLAESSTSKFLGSKNKLLLVCDSLCRFLWDQFREKQNIFE